MVLQTKILAERVVLFLQYQWEAKGDMHVRLFREIRNGRKGTILFSIQKNGDRAEKISNCISEEQLPVFFFMLKYHRIHLFLPGWKVFKVSNSSPVNILKSQKRARVSRPEWL